tara:strand:- start:1544 stop:1822 length:279 start_codon:yes stop_codon:yes gene_type:complete
MTTESKIPDNQKTQNTRNYFYVLIISMIYVLAAYPNPLDDILFFFATAVGATVPAAIISGIIFAFRRRSFSKLYAWLTLITCLLGYFGNNMN